MRWIAQYNVIPAKSGRQLRLEAGELRNARKVGAGVLSNAHKQALKQAIERESLENTLRRVIREETARGKT